MRTRDKVFRIAFCGMMAALGTAVMLLGGVIPIATYATPLLAMLALIPVMDSYRSAAGMTTYFVTALLTLLAGTDKEAAFFYIFIGYYPVLRPALDRLPGRSARTAAKIGVFTAMVALMYLFLCCVLRLDAVLSEMRETGLAVTIAMDVLLVVCLMIYDVVLRRFTVLYLLRLKPKLAKLVH